MFPRSLLLHKIRRRFFPSRLEENLPADQKTLVNQIRDGRLTYLPKAKLAKIVEICERLDNTKTPGMFLEAGCALGGSAIMIAKLKDPARPLSVYDVFDMIPPPGEQDGEDVHERFEIIRSGKSQGLGGDTYYGYEENLFDKVKQNFADFDVDLESQNVSLVKGLVQDTMKIDEPVAFAHIDVDWYDPVMHCLNQITPNLSQGGVIVLDDYFDWSGCRKATDEFLKTHGDKFSLDGTPGSLCLTRRK